MLLKLLQVLTLSWYGLFNLAKKAANSELGKTSKRRS
jgi:hypothetical protein